ncbi:ankyrin repeat-containing domain protein [Apodospora peruviana]|uniref:Ankyrin repeat-containing domain protein n=1 Tax=Apodospora peruviana TaxID=516989 RepID=A0AAE0MCH8_9PEZI|nr:ankyrin repeat-containing domain protein [Apodospora peruviana]
MAPPQLTEDEIDDLIYCARAGEKDELTTLLSALAEREKKSTAEILETAKDQGKSTCLHMATGNGHLEIVSFLISQFDSRPKEEKQAFLDAPNEFGNTGLHWAALGGHLEVVKLLLENGASPALANDKNYLPLDLASFGDKLDVVDYFLKQSGIRESENAAEGGLEGGVADVELDDEDDTGAEGSGSASK